MLLRVCLHSGKHSFPNWHELQTASIPHSVLYNENKIVVYNYFTNWQQLMCSGHIEASMLLAAIKVHHWAERVIYTNTYKWFLYDELWPSIGTPCSDSDIENKNRAFLIDSFHWFLCRTVFVSHSICSVFTSSWIFSRAGKCQCSTVGGNLVRWRRSCLQRGNGWSHEFPSSVG